MEEVKHGEEWGVGRQKTTRVAPALQSSEFLRVSVVNQRTMPLLEARHLTKRYVAEHDEAKGHSDRVGDAGRE